MIRIVIADDDKDLRDLLFLSLSQVEDFEVLAQAGNGNQAVSLCLEHQPDAVFFDIDMPGKSGIEAAAELRDLGVEPYLVFITGREEHALDAFKVNAAAYLLKPVSKDQFQECVDRLRENVATKRRSSRVDTLEAMVEELEHESNTDPLVGAFNRRYMDARLKVESERAKRYGRPLSCVMIDLDYFKKVNDNHGHAMGDKILIQLCEVISNALRIEDSVARYGGEEFLVLLVEAGADSSRATAERIRALIEQHSFGDADEPLKLTASLGVALLRADETAAEMVDRADKALYRAKEKGRNCWVFADKSSQDGFLSSEH